MPIANVYNRLGQSIMPRVAAKVFPDRLNVTAERTVIGSGGGQIKAASNVIYASVPCSYEKYSGGSKFTVADALKSMRPYKVTMLVYSAAGTRFDVDPNNHKFEVAARGLEPAKTFRVISMDDESGIMYEFLCVREAPITAAGKLVTGAAGEYELTGENVELI